MRLKLASAALFLFIFTVSSACKIVSGSFTVDCTGVHARDLVFTGDYANDPTDSNNEIIGARIYVDGVLQEEDDDVQHLKIGTTNDVGTDDQLWPSLPPYTVTVEIYNPAGNGKLERPLATYTIPTGCSAEKPLFNDGRINMTPNATIVGYCTKDKGLVAFFPPYTKPIFTVSGDQIKAALEKATDAKNPKHILIKQNFGQQLWALKSNELQFHNATGYKYDFIFPADRCENDVFAKDVPTK